MKLHELPTGTPVYTFKSHDFSHDNPMQGATGTITQITNKREIDRDNWPMFTMVFDPPMDRYVLPEGHLDVFLWELTPKPPFEPFDP